DEVVRDLVSDALKRAERLRNHTEDAPAVLVHRPGDDAHQPDAPAAVDERMPVPADQLAELGGRLHVDVRDPVAGCAVDGEIHRRRPPAMDGRRERSGAWTRVAPPGAACPRRCRAGLVLADGFEPPTG